MSNVRPKSIAEKFLQKYSSVILATLAVLITAMLVSELACDKSSEPKKFSLALYSDSLPAGFYCVCWNQKDEGGAYVKTGSYSAHIVAGLYDTSVTFFIANSAPHAIRLDCCEGYIYPKFNPAKPIPDKYAFGVHADSCALLDTVSFEYALPVESKVRVSISGL